MFWLVAIIITLDTTIHRHIQTYEFETGCQLSADVMNKASHNLLGYPTVFVCKEKEGITRKEPGFKISKRDKQ